MFLGIVMFSSENICSIFVVSNVLYLKMKLPNVIDIGEFDEWILKICYAVCDCVS